MHLNWYTEYRACRLAAPMEVGVELYCRGDYAPMPQPVIAASAALHSSYLKCRAESSRMQYVTS